MRVSYQRLGIAIALGCLICAPLAVAQEAAKPASRESGGGVPRIEIFNGAMRSVHFFGSGLSLSDRVTLRDIERAENELSLTDQVAILRQQYVSNERALEARRRALQEQLLAPAGYATGVYPDQVPEVDAIGLLSFADTYAGYPAFGYRRYGAGLGFGYGYAGGYPYWGGGAGTTGYDNLGTQPMALGSVDPGPIKTDLAQSLISVTTPEYRAQVMRSLDDALARASQSSDLRAALDLGDKGGVRPAGFESTSEKVEVTLKNGTKVSGTVVREDADQIVINTGTAEVQVRKSEALTITRSKR
jgi:hypothetical protein